MKIRQILAPLLFISFNSFAQTTPVNKFDLPSIIPASPELSSLSNIGQVNNSMFTGAASVSIPLYDIKNGGLSMPISISYSSNGIKVNDIPSRVGLGWNLIAGGSINSTIHDEDDLDVAHTVRVTGNPWLLGNDALGFFVSAIRDYNDTEYDEYSYNVNGMSGKFFFEPNGTIRISEHNNLKIEYLAGVFKLTTAEGVIYHFGQANEVEKTIYVKVNGVTRANNIATTGWFLTKVENLEGDVINFTYGSVSTNVYLGKNQSVVLQRKSPLYVPNNYTNCSACTTPEIPSPEDNRIEYNTKYLTGITCSNGLNINFNYAARPNGDLSNDNRLHSITVMNSGATIKKYEFEYEDVTIPGDINQRFYLSKLKTISNQSNASLNHTFEYIQISGLPSQKSLNQDWFGYANTASNSTHFFPRPANYNDFHYGELGADRSWNFEKTKCGSLKRIVYPTGGSQEFTYEPHIKTTVTSSSTYLNEDQFEITSNSSQYESVSTDREYYINTPFLKLNFTTSATSHPLTSNPNGHPWTRLRVYNTSTGELEYFTDHRENKTEEKTLELEPNNIYKIEITSWNWSHKASVDVKYNESQPVSVLSNDPMPGIRVSKIESKEPLTGTSTTKYYHYADLVSMAASRSMQIEGQPNIPSTSLLKSSSIGMNQLADFQNYWGGAYCGQYPNGAQLFVELCEQYLVQINSTSVAGSLTYSGSPMAYRKVIESDDPDFMNGGTLHEFYAGSPYRASPVVGTWNPGPPSGARLDLNGKEISTLIFKKDGNKFVILRQQKNEYYIDRTIGNQSESFMVRRRFGDDNTTGPQTNLVGPYTTDQRLLAWDAVAYSHISQWAYLKSTTNIEYDEDGHNPSIQKIEYEYTDPFHTLPRSITSTNSKNEETKDIFTYVSEVPLPVYQEMVSKHVISPQLVQKKTIRKTPTSQEILLSTVETEYTKYNGLNNAFYKPSTISSTKAYGITEARINYHKYDINGNPLLVSKYKGTPISYLWSKPASFPIAEVKNADDKNIAYTSFEYNDKGNWAFDEAGIISFGLTGNKGFIGTMSANIDQAKTYVVMLAARSNVTVNNQPGTLVKNIQGLSILKWEISNENTITVDATDLIDEVRLYPINAEISTFTYKPFIGISSACDVNYNIVYYEYDEFNRLSMIKDENNNIIKKIDYEYGL